MARDLDELAHALAAAGFSDGERSLVERHEHVAESVGELGLDVPRRGVSVSIVAARVWAAEICARNRASPFGTTGYHRPLM